MDTTFWDPSKKLLNNQYMYSAIMDRVIKRFLHIMANRRDFSRCFLYTHTHTHTQTQKTTTTKKNNNKKQQDMNGFTKIYEIHLKITSSRVNGRYTHQSKYLHSLTWASIIIHQGPVVQSVVSLTSSLRVISLTVLVDSIHNILIFFAEKMWVAFALQKLLTFFQQKISAYLRITGCKF